MEGEGCYNNNCVEELCYLYNKFCDNFWENLFFPLSFGTKIIKKDMRRERQNTMRV
jgi:hypothetical protein